MSSRLSRPEEYDVGDLSCITRESSHLRTSLQSAEVRSKKLLGTVFTPTLPPAPGQPERRAATRRRAHKSVAIGYYVIVYR
jgi:hypothetical protein